MYGSAVKLLTPISNFKGSVELPNPALPATLKSSHLEAKTITSADFSYVQSL